MKLGKALATGVAEEQPPRVHEEELAPTEETEDVEAASVPEEVPASR